MKLRYLILLVVQEHFQWVFFINCSQSSKSNPENKYWYELQYPKALQESEEVFKQGDKNQKKRC